MPEHILFYDGECGVCNRFVQYVITHEKRPDLFFAPLQSEFARDQLAKFQYDFSQLSTLVLLSGGEPFYKSDAALKLSRFLKAPYSWAIALKLFPRFLRDAVYDFVARRRKRLGLQDFCFLPDAETRKRFLA